MTASVEKISFDSLLNSHISESTGNLIVFAALHAAVAQLSNDPQKTLDAIKKMSLELGEPVFNSDSFPEELKTAIRQKIDSINTNAKKYL